MDAFQEMMGQLAGLAEAGAPPPDALARLLHAEAPEAFAQMMAGVAGGPQVARMDHTEDPPEDAPVPAPGTAVFYTIYDDRAVVHKHTGADHCTVIPEEQPAMRQVDTQAQVAYQRVDPADLTVDEETEALVPGVVVRVRRDVTHPRFAWGETLQSA